MSVAIPGRGMFGPASARSAAPRALDTAGQAPEAPARSEAAVRGDTGIDRFLVNLLSLDLLAVVLLQKWALPLGDAQVSMVIFPHFATLGILYAHGRLAFDARKTLFYLVFAGAAILVNILPDRPFAPTSLLLALVTYATYMFVAEASPASYQAILRNFVRIALGVCVLVFMDHAVQLAGHPIPNMEDYMPTKFIYLAYHYIHPIRWNSTYMIPNAFFMLEPSHTSQFIAMALIVEIYFFQRLRILFFLAVSLLATFAGTGIVLFLLTLPFLLPKIPRWMIWSGVAALPVLVGIAFATGWVNYAAERSEETNMQHSSTDARFIAPVQMVYEDLNGNPWDLLYGIGAGRIEKSDNITWAPYCKVLTEYGYIVFFIWLAFVSYAMFSSAAPFPIAWAVAIQYHLLNGSFLVPLHTIYCFILAAGYVARRDSVESSLDQLRRYAAAASFAGARVLQSLGRRPGAGAADTVPGAAAPVFAAPVARSAMFRSPIRDKDRALGGRV